MMIITDRILADERKLLAAWMNDPLSLVVAGNAQSFLEFIWLRAYCPFFIRHVPTRRPLLLIFNLWWINTINYVYFITNKIEVVRETITLIKCSTPMCSLVWFRNSMVTMANLTGTYSLTWNPYHKSNNQPWKASSCT